MPRSHMFRLWRATPVPRELGDVAQLQTAAYNPTLGHNDWITVARGQPEVMERIARHLSQTHFRLFATTPTEENTPQISGSIFTEEETIEEETTDVPEKKSPIREERSRTSRS